MFTLLSIGVQSITIRLSVCLSVCSHIKKPHVQISLNFVYMSHMAMTWSSSDDNAIRYVPNVRFRE